jgi:maltose alpha-D-glucosyltransferase/alpha-amylase
MASPRHSSPTTEENPRLPAQLGGHSPLRRTRRTRGGLLPRDPLWYKDSIIYEAHVRAFFDSNADGIGDFSGLTQKLDYLQDLGVTAIWLLPFYPSPLKDDGYDIADYYSINPIYGTLKEFRVFLHAAHERQLRVITELVVNHTSDQHPWFQRSRRASSGSPWRDFYVWNEHPDKYGEARIIFRDFEPSNWTWDPLAQAYYWHRFYAHQPDLNYDNPLVHKEITRVLDFWLDMGVDGLRLDAVPYLYEREGTSCENLPETHNYLKSLRRHLDQKYGDRMLLAEANQWPEDAVTYFGAGDGDECHMAFHFPLMPRIFMSVRMEDRVPIVDILQQTPPIPKTSQWALFLRNHDELTLEMVTDEERDYMYRVYANDAKARINLGIRRRLAPLLGNDRKRIELLYLLLFSLPGTPVLYYGDEIGMGDNIFLGDRNGVRTPMQWSSDKNAGFSRAGPHALYLPIILDPEYHYEAINVEAQQQNPNSLLWWMKRTMTLRKRHQAFGRGTLQFLQPENRKILAFIRHYEQENILVVANLSRFPQPALLDLSPFQHHMPVELFGRATFPPITAEPYFLTLAPHAAFWFSLEPVSSPEGTGDANGEPRLRTERLDDLLHGDRRQEFEYRLLRFFTRIPRTTWPNRPLKSVQLRDSLALPSDANGSFLLFLLFDYVEGEPEEYLLPMKLATEQAAEELERDAPERIIARIRLEQSGLQGILCTGRRSKAVARGLLDCMARRRLVAGAVGDLRGFATPALREGVSTPLEPSFGAVPQNNYIFLLGDKYLLKLFRRLEPGPNPDLELMRFLWERDFPNVAAVAGWLEYRRRAGENFTLGMLTRYLPQTQDAWSYTLDLLTRYFERVRSLSPEKVPALEGSLLTLSRNDPPETILSLIGTYLEFARLLGQRTGELHATLACEPQDPDFAPEPFTPFYQRSLFQSMRNLTVQNLHLLRLNLTRLPLTLKPQAEQVLAHETDILKRLRAVNETRMRARRIRCHGDLHLAQVLCDGRDFSFIDFEGEPMRPLGERRIKRSPLRDVASMLRSLDYVSHMALRKQVELGAIQDIQLNEIEPWTSFWMRWVGAAFLRGYLHVVDHSDLLPTAPEQLQILLEAHLLEKAVYELGHELRHRPDWVKIPLRAILQLIEERKQLAA